MGKMIEIIVQIIQLLACLAFCYNCIKYLIDRLMKFTESQSSDEQLIVTTISEKYLGGGEGIIYYFYIFKRRLMKEWTEALYVGYYHQSS